jgi:hypothetical protein
MVLRESTNAESDPEEEEASRRVFLRKNFCNRWNNAAVMLS